METAFHILLSKHLQSRKDRNPSYSLRAFARDVAVNAGDLSRIAAGKKLPSDHFLAAMAKSGKFNDLELAQLIGAALEAKRQFLLTLANQSTSLEK